MADDLVVEHGLVERHRDVLLGLKADGRLELAWVLDRGRRRVRTHALVANPEPHAARTCTRRRAPSGVAEGLRVGDLALAEDPGSSGSTPWRATSTDAVDAHLGGGDAAGLDVEPDDGVVLCF